MSIRRACIGVSCAALLASVGCSADSGQNVPSEELGSQQQYVVWLDQYDDLVSEHMVWHLKGRYVPPGSEYQGVRFLSFHRDYLNRLRARHEAAGRPLSERSPWEKLDDDATVYAALPTSVRSAYDNLINNYDPRTNLPFANEDRFGTYLEEFFHNPLHGLVSDAVNEPELAPIDMSPRSSFFFKIHGLVERMHQAFLRGKFFQTTYSDVIGVSVAHQEFVDVVDVNLLKVAGTTWETTAYPGRTVTEPNCGAYVGAVADLNFDGSNDLVFHYPNCGRGEAVWLLSGVLPNGSPTINWPTVSANWRLIGSGDFNQDLRPDLVWASGRTVKIWYMNGLTRVSSADATLDTNFVGRAVGAMYRGANCIYARNTSTGDNRVYCLKGTTITNTFNLTKVSDQNWDMVGAGYYHSGPLDNKDVLWQNKSTGQGRVWFLSPSFASVAGGGNTAYGSSTLRLEGPR